VNIELQDIIATLNRLDAVQSKTPPPLVSHEASRQRDYPIRPKLGQIRPAPKHAPNAHRAAPAHSWDWRSKQP